MNAVELFKLCVLVPSWGFLYINDEEHIAKEIQSNVLVPSWGFLYINPEFGYDEFDEYTFSSPHGDFFILTLKT